MKTKLLATLGASALLLGGMSIASAASHDAADAKAAAVDADRAGKALARHDRPVAVASAEAAVALAPRNAGYRVLLGQAAHAADATPKLRQNLALSLALTGQWQASRAVAAVDVAPGDLDARMEQWASFARPQGAADQVATLLGVTPVADGGQPVALALGGVAPSIQMAAASAPASVAPAPVQTQVAASVPPVAVAPAPVETAPAIAAGQVAFGPRQEVVQALPATVPAAPRAAVIAADRAPMKVALGTAAPVPHPAPAKGSFVVQLGAFRSAAVAHDAWGRATHRLPALAARGAMGMSFAARGASYYRLSVGGFARGDADAMCHRYRQAGGACFVRAGAGDQVASWTKKTVQVAAR